MRSWSACECISFPQHSCLAPQRFISDTASPNSNPICSTWFDDIGEASTGSQFFLSFLRSVFNYFICCDGWYVFTIILPGMSSSMDDSAICGGTSKLMSFNSIDTSLLDGGRVELRVLGGKSGDSSWDVWSINIGREYAMLIDAQNASKLIVLMQVIDWYFLRVCHTKCTCTLFTPKF